MPQVSGEALELASFAGQLREALQDLACLGEGPSRRFLVLEHLGTTEQAYVYEAIDTRVDRLVVLKVSRQRGDDREVRMLASLTHPNILALYGVELVEGYTCALLPWTWEGDLGAYARLHPWPQVLERCFEVGGALDHLHEAGLVHGEVKAKAVLIDGGIAKLTEFGCTRRVAGQEAGGGPPFTLPPQARLAGAEDVLAWSTMTVELLKGCSSPAPRRIVAAVEQGLEGEPERRPSMAELLEHVEQSLVMPESRRRISMVAAALTGLLLSGWAGHVIAMRCTPALPSSVEPEPSMQRALELAEAGKASEAWDELERLADQEPLEAEQLLHLAELLLTASQASAELEVDERAFLGVLVVRLANQAGMLARRSGQGELQERARLLREQGRALIRCEPG